MYFVKEVLWVEPMLHSAVQEMPAHPEHEERQFYAEPLPESIPNELENASHLERYIVVRYRSRFRTLSGSAGGAAL